MFSLVPVAQKRPKQNGKRVFVGLKARGTRKEARSKPGIVSENAMKGPNGFC